MNEFDRAISTYKKVLELDGPGNDTTWTLLISTFFEAGKFEEAITGEDVLQIL